MNNKNKDILSGILVILILIAVVVLVGVSYAAWTMNAKQTNTNVVSTGCFETSSDLGTSSENEAISLVDAVPINDVDAMSTSGFTFTITNVCKTYATYQVNLETLSTSTLDISYIKAVLNNNTPKKLNEYASVNKYLDTASSSNKLISGGLAQNESVTYTLRLWIGDDTEYTPAISNKTYSGKIVVKSLELVDELATSKIQNLVAGANLTSTDVIEADVASDGTCTNTLAYDGTSDNNLRYVGANPCNYVSFNNELWRIIGLMNNIDDGTGKSETRIKLIREDSLGEYPWDLSTKAVNYGYGINQWGEIDAYEGADLMRELNTDYLNPKLISNPMWYGYQSGYTDSNYITGYGQNTEFDRTKVLSSSSQSLIGDSVWHIGAYNDTSKGSSSVLTSVAYQNERNSNPNATNNGKYCSSTNNGCNDEVTRTYTWSGKVALMNISDYGYAVGGDARSLCLSKGLYGYDNNSCITNNWLFNRTNQWTLSPEADPGNANRIGSVYSEGYVYYKDAHLNNITVRPSLYLKSNVKITGGSGTSTNPYTLAID